MRNCFLTIANNFIETSRFISPFLLEGRFFLYDWFYKEFVAHIIEQMLEFLPTNIKDGLAHVNLQSLYEIRLRAEKPTTVNYAGKYRYLGPYGLTERTENAIRCTVNDIADCVYRAGNYSVYSVEEQLKQGFLTANDGERLGLAGEYVFEKGQPLTIRNFTSLCIRVPHEIVGCSTGIYTSCMRDKIRSLLIMSPPGLGKTTILRDLSRILSNKTEKNLLICDERGEISAGNVGDSCDVMKFADKKTAFESGVRAMRPDIIITDELSAADCMVLEKAVSAGIIVFASAHFLEMQYVSSPFLGLFERYVLLDTNELGKIRGIYDETGREIL